MGNLIELSTRNKVVVSADKVHGGEGPFTDRLYNLQGGERGWKFGQETLKANATKKRKQNEQRGSE